MTGQHENAVVLPFDARDQIERMLTDIGASNPVGMAAQMMRLLVSWKPPVREPRVWNEGDAEPEKLGPFTDRDDDEWSFQFTGKDGFGRYKTGDGPSLPFAFIAAKYGPLTEVMS
jgi:hypothetical protein